MPQAPAHISTQLPAFVMRSAGLSYEIEVDCPIDQSVQEEITTPWLPLVRSENTRGGLSANSASFDDIYDNTLLVHQHDLPDNYTVINHIWAERVEKDKRSTMMWDELNIELFRKSEQIHSVKDQFLLRAKLLIEQISTINFKDCTIEILPEESLNFNVHLTDSLLVMIGNPLEVEEEDFVVFSLFYNDDCQVSNFRRINDVVKGINELIQNIK